MTHIFDTSVEIDGADVDVTVIAYLSPPDRSVGWRGSVEIESVLAGEPGYERDVLDALTSAQIRGLEERAGEDAADAEESAREEAAEARADAARDAAHERTHYGEQA